MIFNIIVLQTIKLKYPFAHDPHSLSLSIFFTAWNISMEIQEI